MDNDARAFLDGAVSPVEPGTALAKPFGRPSTYNPELAGKICEAIAAGMKMEEVAKLPGFPGRSTVFTWLTLHQDFQVSYQGAMDWRAESDADWLMDIALDKSEDYKLNDGEGSVPVLDKTAIERSKLACEQLRYLMEKRAPKKYGKPAPVVIQPLAAPGVAQPGDDARLIGQSASMTIEHPMREQIEAWQKARLIHATPAES